MKIGFKINRHFPFRKNYLNKHLLYSLVREVEDTNILDKFAIEFANIIERYTDYIIVSGFVAISSGRSRGTEDIDMIIPQIGFDLFKKINAQLNKFNFISIQSSKPEEIYNYLNDSTSVRYIKKNQPLPEMELKFARDELDNYQLKTRTKLKLTGLNLWFSNINVNIAFKEELLKSPKDMDDARHLRIVYDELLDEDEIKVGYDFAG